MSNAAAIRRPQAGMWTLVAVGILVLGYSIAIVAAGKWAFLGLFGAMVFVGYVFFPAVGVYVTTALLMLQGSAGILGMVNDNAPLAITLAQIAGVAALGAFVINLLLAKMTIRYNPAVLVIGAFMVWSLLGTILSEARGEEFPHWLRLLARFGFFALTINVLRTPQQMRWYLYIMLTCGALMAFVAMLQFLLPSWQVSGAAAWGVSKVDAAYIDQESLQGDAAIRVAGTAGHSNWMALVMLLLLPLNAWWWVEVKTKPRKALVILVTFMELVALTLTYTRTGLLISFVLLVLIMGRRVVKFSALRVFMFLFAIVVAFAVLPQAYKERVLNPKQYVKSKSVMSRLDLQQAALRYTVQNPVFGLGMGGFGTEYIHENSNTASMMELMVNQGGWQPVFIGTHNMYLQLSADTGVIGLALIIWFFYLLLRYLLEAEKLGRIRGDKDGQMLAESLLISMVAFMLCAMFLHALHQDVWWMVAAGALAHVIYRHDFRPSAPQNEISGA